MLAPRDGERCLEDEHSHAHYLLGCRDGVLRSYRYSHRTQRSSARCTKHEQCAAILGMHGSGILSATKSDAAFGQVIWRDLARHVVTNQNLDVIFANLARHMG